MTRNTNTTNPKPPKYSKAMVILIDNGHGVNTAGKRSPDGRLREYKYTREIAQDLCDSLRIQGYDARRIVTEDKDIPLCTGADTRVKRVNKICQQYGYRNVLLVSIHCNAAGSKGEWMNARGWSAHVSLNASDNSKRLAGFLAAAAEANGIKVRRPLPKQDYWPQNLGICRETLCPAVLTENLFQDNREDVDYLLSDAGRAAIVALHIDGIVRYIKATR